MFQGSDDEDYMTTQVDYMSPTGPQVVPPPSPEVAVVEQPPAPRVGGSPMPQAAASQAVVPIATARPVVSAPASELNPDVTERAHMLGFGLIASSLGAVAGLRIGGVYGGVAGTLFAGSAVNMYRAALHASRRTPDGDREAIISGTYSLIAAGLGGYISYKTADWRKGEPEDRTFAPPLVANRKGIKGLY